MLILSHEVLIVRLAIAIGMHTIYAIGHLYRHIATKNLNTHNYLASYMYKSYTHSYIVTLYAHNFQLQLQD